MGARRRSAHRVKEATVEHKPQPARVLLCDIEKPDRTPSRQAKNNQPKLLESSDKQLLGQVSAEIQKFRPPEPYKGKGILFEGVKIKRKAGKSGKT